MHDDVQVCKETLFVGSVGDSQALLCRLNTPVILNQPHKMTDPREKKRIEAKGGSIQIVDGVERVNGYFFFELNPKPQTLNPLP